MQAGCAASRVSRNIRVLELNLPRLLAGNGDAIRQFVYVTKERSRQDRVYVSDFDLLGGDHATTPATLLFQQPTNAPRIINIAVPPGSLPAANWFPSLTSQPPMCSRASGAR